MIINRHNYEEFFLLYVDKELNPEEQAAVEIFIGRNPDLAEELNILQQTTLHNTNIPFEQKNSLYKKENSISYENYEEYFLLFADNELDEHQVAEVENFVLKHPKLQNEFTLLQQIKLQPEFFAFKGKEKLYRKEKDQRRIILLTLTKMGVAASVAAIVYLSIILNSKNNTYHASLPVKVPSLVAAVKVTRPVETKADSKRASLTSLDKRKDNVQKALAATGKTEKILHQKIKEAKRKEELIDDIKSEESKKEDAVNAKDLAAVEKDSQQPQIPNEGDDTKKIDDNSSEKELASDNNKHKAILNQPVANEENPLVTHAVYLETDNIEEQKTLYVGSVKVNKNKLKGFFRKAINFLDKKVNGDDN